MRLHASRTIRVEPALPAALEPLRDVAANLFWSWNTDAVALFRRIDPAAWEACGHNPTRLLQIVPPARFTELADDSGFLTHLGRNAAALSSYLARERPALVPQATSPGSIAYFSLEFAITESLPVYSGGLGVLAGDHLKSASDLGLPLVGVSLLYRQGYFQQALQPDGWQQEAYQDIDFGTQPLVAVKDEVGEPILVSIPFDGRDVYAAVWKLTVGSVALFLLDTDVAQNGVADRAISGRLYGGDVEMRIHQEMVLGIGGVRALQAMGFEPAVCHMNEGHSSLLAVERIRMLMERSGAAFEEARLPVAAATVFTTHTAVAAGIDLFPPELVQRNLGRYYGAMGLDDRAFLGLGRNNPDDPSEPFSMALLGLKLSGFRNGVSKLHGAVSQQLWESFWPNLPSDEIPIGHVTNGVHLPSWVAHEVGDLFDSYVGREWRDEPDSAHIWLGAQTIPDAALWNVHELQRRRLVTRARAQHRESQLRRGDAPGQRQVLHDGVLTIAFARRFASYKRATLLFRDLDRLANIVNNPDRPVQFVFAGKSHPRDEGGKQLIRELVAHTRVPELRDRMIVLERYDVELARVLVQGADVWLNTPLRPLEASGTSGMKAVANGALHFSILDGWWAEAYEPGLGWSIGGETMLSDREAQDAADADALYTLLEDEIVPTFYERDADGLPAAWLTMMKRSIATFAPRFNTSRMVQDYAREAYTPAASSWTRLSANGLHPAKALAAWRRRVAAEWHRVKILAIDGPTESHGNAGIAAGQMVEVVVQVHTGALNASDLQVDIVHGPTGLDGALTASETASLVIDAVGEDGVASFKGAFRPTFGGQIGYAVRLMPYHPDLHNPFETGLVLWA